MQKRDQQPYDSLDQELYKNFPINPQIEGGDQFQNFGLPDFNPSLFPKTQQNINNIQKQVYQKMIFSPGNPIQDQQNYGHFLQSQVIALIFFLSELLRPDDAKTIKRSREKVSRKNR